VRVAVDGKDTDDAVLEASKRETHPGHGLLWLELQQLTVQRIAWRVGREQDRLAGAGHQPGDTEADLQLE
jgi:hypothetical protein